MCKLCEFCLPYVHVRLSVDVSVRKGFAEFNVELDERVCARCGFASKMEAALFVLQTCRERIPQGGLSCANLFHNDWNVTEPRP